MGLATGCPGSGSRAAWQPPTRTALHAAATHAVPSPHLSPTSPGLPRPVNTPRTTLRTSHTSQKCPFEAIMIINLPKDLSKETTHRYGPNSFKLHRCEHWRVHV
jgi:hypothetical protein